LGFFPGAERSSQQLALSSAKAAAETVFWNGMTLAALALAELMV
jgi:hypothetical protein